MHYRSLYLQIVRRLLLTVFLPGLALITTVAISLRELNRAQLRQELLNMGREVRAVLTGDPKMADLAPQGDYISFCRTIEARTGARAVLIRSDGEILGDSRYGAYKVTSPMERHEIVLAMDGIASTNIRKDSVTEREYLDATVPIRRGRTVIGAINLSHPWDDWKLIVIELIQSAMFPLFGLLALILVAAHFISSYYGKNLHNLSLQTAALTGKTKPDPHFESDPLQQLSTEMTEMRRTVQNQVRIVERDKKQWEALFTSMREGFLAVNDSMEIITINDAARRFLELPCEGNLAGRQLFSAVRNADLNDFCNDLVAGKKPFMECEIELTHADNRNYVLQLSGARFEQYHYVGALVIISDVTRVRHLEEGRKEFVANVSHELKTPLASLKGYLEMLEDSIEDDPEHAKIFLNTLDRNVERMNAIIDDLLTLSRLELNMQIAKREFEEADLCECIRHCISLHEARMAERQVKLEMDLNICCANANHRLMEQAVSNLLGNAIKYSPKGASIKISAKAEEGLAAITVQDNGPGIPKDAHEAVFERFYRVDKSRDRQTGGTGLGLAIVKHICRLHDGSVSLQSEVGKGSTFTIRIPRNG